MSRVALLGTFVFVVAGLSGCASPAKVIHRDQNSVVIAVPDNTNVWPWYYQDEARKVAAEALPGAEQVSGPNRVKVGEQMTNRQDTTRRDINGKDKTMLGEITSSLNTTSIADTYEYHLVFEVPKKSDLPNFLNKSRTPPPTPDGPPINAAGGVIAPRERSGPAETPAIDIRMPMIGGSSTDLPPTSLSAPGPSAGYMPK
jgi:hypothetical protein